MSTPKNPTAKAAALARQLAEAQAKADQLRKGRHTRNSPAHRATIARADRLRRSLEKITS